MAEAETLTGGCHCGAVEYRVTIPKPERAMACNCSICSRAGWLLAFTPATNFELVRGEEALGDYQFAGHKLHHLLHLLSILWITKIQGLVFYLVHGVLVHLVKLIMVI